MYKPLSLSNESPPMPPPDPIIDTTDLILLNDSNLGTATNQFNFSKGWNYEKLIEDQAYNGDNHWTIEVGATVAVNFVSPKFHIVAIKDPNHGIMTLSIDGGSEIDVDLYSSKRTFKQIVYESSVLSNSEHKIVLKCSGRKNTSANGIAASIDAIFIEPMPIIDPTPPPTPPSTLPTTTSPITPTTNLALKKTVMASSNTSSANFITDGQTTKWSSGNFDAGHQWIYIDLGIATDFDTLKIFWYISYATIYRIEISNDSMNWSSIYRTTNGTGKIEEISLSSIQKARFVRLYCEQSLPNMNNVDIYEIEIYNMHETSATAPKPITPTTNLALKKPVIASSNTSSANFITDGRSTKWSSENFINGPQWIYVDLGVTTDFDNLRIYWSSENATIYRIETSNDSMNWSSIYKTTNGKGRIEEISLSSTQKARFVRLYCEKNSSNISDKIAIYEIEVRNKNITSPPTDPVPTQPQPTPTPISTTNLALKKSVMASSNVSSAKYITDGRATRWSSGSFANDHQWVFIDLGVSTNFDTIKIYWGQDNATIYKIDISNDAITWTSIYRTTNGKGSIEEITLNSIQKARFIRVYCEQANTAISPIVSIYEIKVYNISGNSMPTTSPNPTTNLALKKSVMASSNASFTKYITDGRTTSWSSGSFANSHQWVFIDLGVSTDFNTVKIHWGRNNATIYKIDISNDAITWTSVYRTTNGKGSIEEITLNSIQKARFIRVYCEQANTAISPIVSIYEIEIFNN
ncbi:discoidin domain-containing protein [Clostridium tarantellae]|uniref:F5/8 type C domain-containing protein n=1 Tax=Clostridium tarantellae TaxID=39493 RepID=A0A6I1MMS5_9CLOT|nr:discoidin domain-containing protein [Clostridium tarantellae]MPQ44324.1 hypothetical protein [Clostridium tarantellae]